MSEPKEFWIDAEIEKPSVHVTFVWKKGETGKSEGIHVIEKSYADKLAAELASLKEKHAELLSYLPKVPSEPYEKQLAAELERERMRLAACGVAALGYFDGCAEEYKSASLNDVLQLWEKRKQLELELARKDEALKFYSALSNIPLKEIIEAFQAQSTVHDIFMKYTERARQALKPKEGAE